MKLARIVHPAFQQAFSKLNSKSLPLRAAFKLKNIASKVKEEHAKYEELRRAGLERFGTKDDNGKLLLDSNDNVQLSKENFEAFVKELNDLNSAEIVVDTIKLSELGDNVELSSEELSLLDDVIVDG